MKKIFKVLLLVVLTFTCSQFVYSEGLEMADLNFLVETTQEINSTRNAAPQAATDSGAYSIYIKKLKLRQEALAKIAKNDPRLALKYVVKSDRRNKQPLKAQTYIEESKSINGIISVIHIDDFKDHDKSKYRYSVNDGNQKVAIYTTKDISTQSGAKVSIKGYRLNQNEFLTEGDSNSIVISEAPDVGALGKQRSLVLLVNSKFDASELVTPKEIENYINNGPFQKFIKEASYGKTWFEAKTYGWITLNTGDIGNMCYGGGNSFDLNTTEIKDYIRKQNINLHDFDRVIFLYPGVGGCSGVGKTNYSQYGVNLSESWVALYKYSFEHNEERPFLWSSFDYVLTHEIGHALGLMHANGLDCDKQSFTSKCEHVEYGNNYDAMGSGGTHSLHFNGPYKEILGWIKTPNILFVSKSGDYFVDNLESTSTVAKKFAKVYVPSISNSQPSAMLEHRANYGFDAKKADTSPNTDNSGLLYSLPVFVNNNTNFSSSRLIDLHPSDESWYSDIVDAGLRVNDGPINDEGRGVTLKILKQSKFGTNFNIKLDTPKCVRGLIGDVIKQEIDSPVSVGGNIYTFLSGYNSDSISCGKSLLRLEAKLPDGWKLSEQSKQIFESVPGETYYAYPGIELSDDAKRGPQTLGLSILNTETGVRSGVVEYQVEVIDRPIIDSLTPSIARPGSQMVVKGGGFFKNHQSSVYVINDDLGMYEAINADITFDTVKFVFPKTFCKYTPEAKEGNCTVTPLKNGEYNIRIEGYSYTSTNRNIQFLDNDSDNTDTTEPISVEIIRTPRVEMKYDSTNDENEVISTFDVEIQTGASKIKIPKKHAFQVSLDSSKDAYGYSSQKYSKPSNAQDDGSDMYTLAPNSKFVFRVESGFNPKVLHGGLYTGVISRVYFFDADGKDISNPIVDNNKTKQILIVGEKSPYINSVMNISSPNQKVATLSPGDVLRISGVKFSTNTDSTIAFYASNQGCARKTVCRISSSYIIKSSDSKNIDFTIPNIFDDMYYVQVIDKKTGASNMVELIITKPKAASANTVNIQPSSTTSIPIQPKVVPTVTTPTAPATVTAPTIIPTPSVSPIASTTTTYTIPYINRISPTSGSAGTTVTLDGVNFEGVDAYTIFLRNNKGGEINPDDVVVTSTRITFKVPNTTYGTYSLSLLGNAGDSNTVNFIITAPPTNTSSVFDWIRSIFNYYM